MEIFEEIGHNIRSLRKAIEPAISINRLAAAAEIDPGQLSRAERGLAGLSLPALVRIADTLGVSLARLIDRQVAASETDQVYTYTYKKDRASLTAELAKYILNDLLSGHRELMIGKTQKQLLLQQLQASISEGAMRGQIKVEEELVQLIKERKKP